MDILKLSHASENTHHALTLQGMPPTPWHRRRGEIYQKTKLPFMAKSASGIKQMPRLVATVKNFWHKVKNVSNF